MAVIVNDHGNGEVDAFYMYFYPFNWGGVVFDENVDDHVGVSATYTHECVAYK